MKTTACALLIALLPSVPTGAANDDEAWPQWLGPSRNGAASAPAGFPRSGPVRLRTAWRRPLGLGTAGLAVSAGTLVTLESEGSSVSAVALSAADGSVLWRAPSTPVFPTRNGGRGALPPCGAAGSSR